MNLIKHQYFFSSTLSLFVGIIGIINLQKESLKSEYNKENNTTFAQQEQALKTKIEIQNKLPAFGFDNLIADWNYLQFVQYFGDLEARIVTGYPLVTDYFEVVVDRDPLFMKAALSLSPANSLFAANPEKTIELLDKVLESISPDSQGYPFMLWTYKASDEILFLGDLEAAKHSYKMAAKWARWRKDDIGEEMAGRYDKTARFLANNPDSSQARFGAWMTVFSNTQDQKTQNYILNQLKQLGAEVNVSPDGKLEIKPPKLNQA